MSAPLDQYAAITEADRRWGERRLHGIALREGDQCVVGVDSETGDLRKIYGRGASYEEAFRDAEAHGHAANGIFAVPQPC